MKKLTPKHKQLLDGIKTLRYGESTVILQFDKIGRLCEMTPRVDDLFNRHRGHQRDCIPAIIEYLNFINYGKKEKTI